MCNSFDTLYSRLSHAIPNNPMCIRKCQEKMMYRNWFRSKVLTVFEFSHSSFLFESNEEKLATNTQQSFIRRIKTLLLRLERLHIIILQQRVTGNTIGGTYTPKKKEKADLSSVISEVSTREGITDEESDDGALAITMTACLHLFSLEMDWKGWLLHWFTGSCMAQRKRSKLAFVLLSFSIFFSCRGSLKDNFVSLILCWEGDEENTQSLWQVVEAHRHADIAGKADVDAEVDQPLFPRAWKQDREHGDSKNMTESLTRRRSLLWRQRSIYCWIW